ncbi:MAG TPA: phosphoglucomutase (alpha-D-glucose-1,6-bisphosphate-dependent) [Rhizomicrobium sp.]|nr:phosphoglucomutase (alpha-D-glucose-1,6-bisphosphate-dependent) [Rhizomicrobium sp.]
MSGAIDPRAGQMPTPRDLIDVTKLTEAYYSRRPDPAVPSQRVAFGTSGHRGSAFDTAFNEVHILAITQAICDYRKQRGTNGPLFVGRDTHALSEPAFRTALEVLVANDVAVQVDARDGYTPTPAVSHAILVHNRERGRALADGIVITPSHNPPGDGGFKYNPPHGGPAQTEATSLIEREANLHIASGLAKVRREPYERVRKAAARYDYIASYVGDLGSVIDMEAIASSGLRVGADPLGGAAVHYWAPIAETYRIDLTVVNEAVDPTFRFVPIDWDGKIRMDCSSPYAMRGLLAIKDRFDLSFANDTDADRHGIVCRSGLMPPNHYLAACADYLKETRERWPRDCAIGKTVVSSAMIDRVAAKRHAALMEVPVGFKWFVNGLLNSTLGFGGEESAGSSFLRRDGTVWTTDKDGLIAGLLAAEMTARGGADPSVRYARLAEELGRFFYARVDRPASPALRKAIAEIDPKVVGGGTLAGDRISDARVTAPGNRAPIGGIKVSTARGWFAVRPSGTENVYKIYSESFVSQEHLAAIQDDAQTLIASFAPS